MRTILSLLSVLVLAINASGQGKFVYELKTTPLWVCGDIRLVAKSKQAIEPQEKETVTIGKIAEDHFILHGRRFDISLVQDLSDAGTRYYQIVGKPDAAGGYSLTIVQPIKDRSPAKVAALIISYQPRDLSEKSAEEGYLLLMPQPAP